MKECFSDVTSIKDELIKYRLASLKTHEGIYTAINNSRMILPKLYHISQPSASILLIDLLNKMKESHYNRLEHNSISTSCIMMEFLIALSRELTFGFQHQGISVSAMRSTRLIHDLLSYFQSSYALEITGKNLEEKFSYNFDHMNRIFKKATGVTIFAYLNDLRISKAKQMLSSGIGKISEVSEQSGFRDVYYFSKVFKKLTGITPAAYARRNN
jgi:YesN/AraC family two-component response regulator